MKAILSLILAFLCSSEGKFSCSIDGARSDEECLGLVNKNGKKLCVWCSIDGSLGVCMTEEESNSINTKLRKTVCKRLSLSEDADTVKDGVLGDQVANFVDQVTSKDDETLSEDDAPYTDDHSAYSDDQNPTTDDESPPSDDEAPYSDDEAPPSDDEAPYSDDEAPPSDDEAPTTDDESPPSDDETPSDDEAPPSDDEVPPSDDEVPPSDDAAPPSDDEIPPTDDNAVPDDFWTCLQKKTSIECDNANCTWCDTKAGFGMCMTGPAAESAKHSSWFNCSISSDNFDESYGSPFLRVQSRFMEKVNDPLDPSCVMAFLTDQTEAGCTSATDKNGEACEWCTIEGITTICLTSDQAAMGSQLGVSCDAKGIQDPYDPSCAVAFLQDPSKDSCLSTLDSDGAPCEYCSLQGSINICLNQEQASLVEQLGVDCDEASDMKDDVKDPYDASCAIEFLKDYTKETCLATVDADGVACEFCTLPGAVSVCLNQEQAALAQEMGLDCEEDKISSVVDKLDDPYDTSCLLAYLQDPSEEGCLAAQDEDGESCKFCSLQNSVSLCLTPEQASYSEQVGITCDSTRTAVDLPPDFLSCLENYQEGDCDAACTWCNTEVGIGFCLAPTVAEATKACTFFDCEFANFEAVS